MSIQETRRGGSRPLRRVASENQLSLLGYRRDRNFAIRESAYRNLGFKGLIDLERLKAGPDFWESSPAGRERVLHAVIMRNHLLYSDTDEFREDTNLWERTQNDRARIIFAAVMGFINISFSTEKYDMGQFYEAVERASLGDDVLKPLRRGEEAQIDGRESEEDLKTKLEKAWELTQNDPTQIILWENEGLKTLPNEVLDYLIGITSTIRHSAIPDYEEELRKQDLLGTVRRDWRKPIDPNVRDVTFLIHARREDKRRVIEVDTKGSVPYATSDPRQAFLAEAFEPSVYDRNFSYTRVMKYWDKEFIQVAKEKGIKPDEAKVYYESRWGWIIFSKRVKETEFDSERAKVLLNKANPGLDELLEQAAVALYGKIDPKKFDPEREILGFRLLERGHTLFRNPIFPRASRIENERGRDLQKLRKDQRKKDEFEPQAEALARNQGKEQLVVNYYTKMVTHWISEFLDIAGFNNPLYREYADLHDRNLMKWEVYEKFYARKRGQTRSTMNKKTVQEYETKLENADELSPEELYRLAINALRNPFKGKEIPSELMGFKLLEACFKKATNNPNDQLNKAFFARVLIEEYARKWVKNKPRTQTEPKIRSIIYTIMKSVWGMKRVGESPLTLPSLKPLQENQDGDEIPR